MKSYNSSAGMSSNGGTSSISGIKSCITPFTSMYSLHNWFSKSQRLEIVTCNNWELTVVKLSYIFITTEFLPMFAVSERPRWWCLIWLNNFCVFSTITSKNNVLGRGFPSKSSSLAKAIFRPFIANWLVGSKWPNRNAGSYFNAVVCISTFYTS